MVRVLPAETVEDLLSLSDLLEVVRQAFEKQGAGAVERPERPHYPLGTGLDGRAGPAGTGLVMAAYIHGSANAATKFVTVHPDNPERGLPTVNAQIALTDAETGQPASFMAGTTITNARTGCIGGLAAMALANSSPITLGIIGAGTQARWQARSIVTATDVAEIRIYSPSESREACARELRGEFGGERGEFGDERGEFGGDVHVEAVDTPAETVVGADVVVTATTSETPVFDGDDLEPGTLVVAVGAYTAEMQEIDTRTFERASQVFADVPEEVIEIGDLRAAGLVLADLIPFSDVATRAVGREDDEDIIVVESVGTAVLDAATAAWVYDQAVAADAGTTVSL